MGVEIIKHLAKSFLQLTRHLTPLLNKITKHLIINQMLYDLNDKTEAAAEGL
jgi:hypothetical protein